MLRYSKWNLIAGYLKIKQNFVKLARDFFESLSKISHQFESFQRDKLSDWVEIA